MVPQKKCCLTRVLLFEKLTSKKKRGDGGGWKASFPFYLERTEYEKSQGCEKAGNIYGNFKYQQKTRALGRGVGGEAPETGKAALTDKPHYAKGGRRIVLNFKQDRTNNFRILDLTLKQCKFASGKSVKMLL